MYIACMTIVDYRFGSFLASLFMVFPMILMPTLASGFSPNEVEEQLATLILTHSKQKRESFVFDPNLSLAARVKAEDMGKRWYTAHVDPDGIGPNALARIAGYELPAAWAQDLDANSIESIAFGHASAKQVFDSWLNSSVHREHVLGDSSFFRAQTRYGIGYAEAPGSRFGRYYVLMTAPPSESPNADVNPQLVLLLNRYTPKEVSTFDIETEALEVGGLVGDNPLQTALGRDLGRSDQLSKIKYLPETDEFELAVPLNYDADGKVEVQYSTDLKSWKTEPNVRREDGRFVLDRIHLRGYLRLVMKE